MNCEDFKNSIITGIYGKLTASQKEDMENHVRKCPKCERLYQRTQGYYGVFEEKEAIPMPDWEKSWAVISEKTTRKRSRFTLFPYKRYALAATSVLVVFILGFFTGRRFFFRAQNGSLLEAPADFHYASTQYYAESLELLLVNFTNQSDQEAKESFNEVERKIITDVLAQTRLLKLIASRRGDPVLQELLEDVELILIGISNLAPEDKDSADQLNQFIIEKSLKLRLRQLAKDKSA